MVGWHLGGQGDAKRDDRMIGAASAVTEVPVLGGGEFT